MKRGRTPSLKNQEKMYAFLSTERRLLPNRPTTVLDLNRTDFVARMRAKMETFKK